MTKHTLAPNMTRTSARKMGRTKSVRKRANKREFRARLKLELEGRQATIAGLQTELKQAVKEAKIAKR